MVRLAESTRRGRFRSPHESGEFLRGDLQIGVPGEFFDRDPIDVAEVHTDRNPSPRP